MASLLSSVFLGTRIFCFVAAFMFMEPMSVIAARAWAPALMNVTSGDFEILGAFMSHMDDMPPEVQLLIRFISNHHAVEGTGDGKRWIEVESVLPPVLGTGGKQFYKLMLKTSLPDCGHASVKMRHDDFEQIHKTVTGAGLPDPLQKRWWGWLASTSSTASVVEARRKFFEGMPELQSGKFLMNDRTNDAVFEGMMTLRHVWAVKNGEKDVYKCGNPVDIVLAFFLRLAEGEVGSEEWVRFQGVGSPVKGIGGRNLYPLRIETSLPECPIATIKMRHNDFNDIWMKFQDVVSDIEFPEKRSLLDSFKASTDETEALREVRRQKFQEIMLRIFDSMGGGKVYTSSSRNQDLFKLFVTHRHFGALARGENDMYTCRFLEQDISNDMIDEKYLAPNDGETSYGSISIEPVVGNSVPDPMRDSYEWSDVAEESLLIPREDWEDFYKEIRMIMALDELDVSVDQGKEFDLDLTDGGLIEKTKDIAQATAQAVDITFAQNSDPAGKSLEVSEEPASFDDFMRGRLACRTDGGHVYCRKETLCAQAEKMRKTTCVERIGKDVTIKFMSVCNCARWNFAKQSLSTSFLA